MEPVGTVVAATSPGAPVAREVFDTVLTELLAGCGDDIAGVYLMFHGSALVTGVDDPEGAIVSALRGVLPAEVPIAISLDLHAYMTDAMMEKCDVVTAYRTCPHIDLYRAGFQAGDILARAVLGEVRPVVRRVRIPMITPPERHDSTQELFSGLQEMCAEAESEGALAAALLCTQPWLNVEGLGWSAVVTTDADPVLAEQMARRMAARAWESRHEFLQISSIPVAEAVDFALTKEGPFVVADIGDATNGGSLGDSTEVLRALLDRQGRGLVAGPSAVSVVDEKAVQEARRVGEGAEVELIVGTGAPGSFNEATRVHGRVRTFWSGSIVYSHPAARGLADTPGDVAIVDVDDVALIVHTRPVRIIDPAIYESVGLRLEDLRLVQAKSHVSYRAGFDPFTTGSVLADTAGPTAANLTYLPFTKRPTPLYPFEDFEWSPDHADTA
jgi:microcystin degradation protein MlrC